MRDLKKVAELTALVLVGRAHHAARVLKGAQKLGAPTPNVLKDKLRDELILTHGTDPWHRDGLLFEIICWLVARSEATDFETISDPHLHSTQQGTDTLKISFDPSTRRLTKATIYEYKCTKNPRKKFKKEVLPAFENYLAGRRDNEIIQTAIGLLLSFDLGTCQRV